MKTQCLTPDCPRPPTSKRADYCDTCMAKRREDKPYEAVEETRRLLSGWVPPRASCARRAR